jgi:hypothetical protein
MCVLFLDYVYLLCEDVIFEALTELPHCIYLYFCKGK